MREAGRGAPAAIGSAAEPVAAVAVLERRLKVRCEVSKRVAATLGLPEIMDRTLAALFEIFEAAERAFILLVGPQGAERRDDRSKEGADG